ERTADDADGLTCRFLLGHEKAPRLQRPLLRFEIGSGGAVDGRVPIVAFVDRGARALGLWRDRADAGDLLRDGGDVFGLEVGRAGAAAAPAKALAGAKL